jgi:hypothetical protein
MDVEKKLTSFYPEKHDKQPAKHLVGRFKFMDLMPCTQAALDTMGVERIAVGGGDGAGPAEVDPADKARAEAVASAAPEKPRLYGPDLRMLGPFKPNRDSPPGIVYVPDAHPPPRSRSLSFL